MQVFYPGINRKSVDLNHSALNIKLNLYSIIF